MLRLAPLPPLDCSATTMPSPLPPLVYSLPLDKRPPPSISDYIQVFVFNAVFLLGILGLHSVQVFLAMPFYVSQSTLSISYAVGRVAQSTFAKLLVLISMVWAPTVIRVTVDTDGNDDTLNLDKIVRYNDQGIAVGLDLPERMVLMSNHQVYCVCAPETGRDLVPSDLTVLSLRNRRLVLHLEPPLLWRSAGQSHHHTQSEPQVDPGGRARDAGKSSSTPEVSYKPRLTDIA